MDLDKKLDNVTWIKMDKGFFRVYLKLLWADLWPIVQFELDSYLKRFTRGNNWNLKLFFSLQSSGN